MRRSVLLLLLGVVVCFTESLQWLPGRLLGGKNRSKYYSIRQLQCNIGDAGTHPLIHSLIHSLTCHVIDFKLDDQLRNLFDTATSLAVPGDTKETLINLINYGDNWIKKYNNTDSNWTYRYPFAHLFIYRQLLIGLLFSNWEKVTGCMADVRIDTTINNVLSNNVLTYKFQASADSRVARGHSLTHSLHQLFNHLLTYALIQV